MQCLKCRKDGVAYKNATDIGDAGSCTIACTYCGQEHDSNVVFDSPLSLPVPWWKWFLFSGIVALIFAVAYGIQQIVMRLS